MLIVLIDDYTIFIEDSVAFEFLNSAHKVQIVLKVEIKMRSLLQSAHTPSVCFHWLFGLATTCLDRLAERRGALYVFKEREALLVNADHFLVELYKDLIKAGTM